MKLLKHSCHAGLLVFGMLSVTFGAVAAELVRGPYLQSATPSSVIVRWRTDQPTTTVVTYGRQPDDLSLREGNARLTTEHQVLLSDLTPGTIYWYGVGSHQESLAKGANYFFRTPLAFGDAAATRIWVVGDSGGLGGGYGNPKAVRDAYYREAASRYTDVWLTLGDNAYDDGLDWEYQSDFFELFPLMLGQTAVWSTIGNHEAYAAPLGKPIPYLSIFSFPAFGEAGGVPSGTERYYSFNHGPIHFISLDSMTQSRATNSAMANWLRADLNQNTNRWTIAFWHHPPYSKGSHDSDREIELIEMRQNIVPILEEHGVDLVLSGHSHIYERSFLLHGHYGMSTNLQPGMILDHNNGREDETGPYVKYLLGPAANQGCVYVVMGSSSAVEPPTGMHPVMFMQAKRTGSLILDIDGPRLDARFLGSSGVIEDHFTILKEEPELLHICEFRNQSGTVIVRCRSNAGLAYQLESTTNLASADYWSPVGEAVTATGTTTSWTNTMPIANKLVFYRVRQVNQ